MLQDIAVLLPVDRPVRGLVDCATSVATLFEAHLDGIACVYENLNPMIATEAAGVVMAAQYETGVERSAVVLDQFEIATRRLGIPHDARSTFDISYATTRSVTAMSRHYDLNIVLQPDRSNPSQADFLSGGRAVRIRAADDHDSLYRTGSGQGRSCADLLGRRRNGGACRPRRHAVSSQGESHRHRQHQRKRRRRREASVEHIDRPPRPARPVRNALPARPSDTANLHNVILSLAAGNGTDLIVMGGYGHSRLREFILGGTTRGMFETLTVPATDFTLNRSRRDACYRCTD